MEETPSRSLSNRFRKVSLSGNNKVKEQRKKGFLDDSFDSSFDSTTASPFLRQCSRDDSYVEYSPLTRGIGSIQYLTST